jgi:hypothetical protein
MCCGQVGCAEEKGAVDEIGNYSGEGIQWENEVAVLAAAPRDVLSHGDRRTAPQGNFR